MDTGESAQETVKTIAWGMPVIRLHLWRLRSCASSICTRGRGCWLKHPAFPAPSVSLRDHLTQTLDASRVPRTCFRAPDAAQRETVRCCAGAHDPARCLRVPAPRRTAQEALHRVRDTRAVDTHFAPVGR